MWDNSNSFNYTLKCSEGLRERPIPPVTVLLGFNEIFGESGKFIQVICNTVSNLERFKL